MQTSRMVRLLFLPFCLFFLAGCATSLSRQINPPTLLETHDSLYLENVPAVAQDAYQCGPAALESVIRYWGDSADADEIGQTLYKSNTRGVFNFSLAQYASSRGFWSQMQEDFNSQDLKQWLRKKVPLIVMLDTGVLWARKYHFVVLKGFNDSSQIFYANTGVPETQAIDYKELERRWRQADNWTLIIAPPERVDWELNEKQSIEIALIFENKGDWARAEQWLKSVLEKNPQSATARFNLANVYRKSQKFEQAETIYQELLKQYPTRSEISNNLAWLYYEQARYPEALEVIETAFKNGAPETSDILDTKTSILRKINL